MMKATEDHFIRRLAAARSTKRDRNLRSISDAYRYVIESSHRYKGDVSLIHRTWKSKSTMGSY